MEDLRYMIEIYCFKADSYSNLRVNFFIPFFLNDSKMEFYINLTNELKIREYVLAERYYFATQISKIYD